MKKRFWALFLAVMMVVSILPTSAFAEGDATHEGVVTATKTLRENRDGTYTITLSVQGNPVTTNVQPNADVVLVVDNSGSMASKVGRPCDYTKDQFEEVDRIELTTLITKSGFVWYIYECPNCGARYVRCNGQALWGIIEEEIYDDRPDECTGEAGTVVRINAAIEVSKEFAESILDINGNKIAVIGFAHQETNGGADDAGAIKVAQGLTNNLSAVNAKIDSMDANGGTNYSAALQEAYNYLDARSNADKENRPGYVIFISDGAPGRSGESFNDRNWNGADQVAALKKAGITVYTVGIALDTSAANYLKSMASEKQSDHFINVTGSNYQDQLSDILEQWAEKIKTVPAGKNAVMTDIVDTDKFTIEDYDDGLTLAADGKTLTWSIGNIPEETATITITVSAKDGVHGSNIPTNKNVYLTYTPASSDTSVTIPEAEIGKPVVDIDAPVTYTVTYDANRGAFADGFDNVFEGLFAGDDMPNITTSDEPTMDGHNFVGWGEAADSTTEADIPATVSGNVTYYAIWEKILTYPVTYTYEPAGVPAAAPTNQYTYSVGQQVTVAAKPDDVKVGGGTWKFQQWTLNGVEVAANSKVDMVEGGLNFIGIWEYEADKPAEYPVTYTYQPADVPASAPTNQYTYSVGQQVTVAAKPDDVKVGGGTWKFQQWTLNGAEVVANSKVAMIEGGLHFVGIWEYEPDTYTVTYTANGGTGTTVDANSPYVEGAQVTQVTNGFTKEGFVFADWEEVVDATVAPVTVEAGQFVMPARNVVFQAAWTQEPIPGISITKVADDTSVKVGDKVTYTITVKNTGNVDLTNVKITDEFLDGGKGNKKTEGTWSIDTLKPGESIVAKLIYTTVSDDVKGLKNSAVVETNETEDSASTEDVTVTKKNDPVHPVGPSKPQLNKEDHYAYIVGYPDGLVHPEKNITRAEVATIFFRMLLDESREDFWAQENWFFDVMPTDWFNNAVSTLANANLINGYPDGNYRPNANITRAEFATIAIRFFLEEDVEIVENNLSDVKGHWAEANINLAYALNLINGYPDGTFRPDQQITRAEAMTIVNRVLERAPHKDHLLDDMIEWPDNMDEDVWYYADVQEATNSHEFYKTKDKDEDKVHEIWTELLPVRDWVALEQAWSQANSSKNPGEVVDINISTPEASDDTLKLN